MSDTSPGASVNRHVADAVLGNAIVSLRFVLLVSNITSLSNPNAIPPCGGAPYLNAKYTIVIGDQELENNSIAIKNMTTGESENIQLLSTLEIKELVWSIINFSTYHILPSGNTSVQN